MLIKDERNIADINTIDSLSCGDLFEYKGDIYIFHSCYCQIRLRDGAYCNYENGLLVNKVDGILHIYKAE